MDKGDPDGDLAGQGPSSGTALQEISFWLNLERALLRIQEKLESVKVALTLNVLKHGKRFHGTVSFDTDTRLKQALATAIDYPIAEGLLHQRHAVRH